MASKSSNKRIIVESTDINTPRDEIYQDEISQDEFVEPIKRLSQDSYENERKKMLSREGK